MIFLVDTNDIKQKIHKGKYEICFFILPLKKTCFKKSSSLNLYDNNAD